MGAPEESSTPWLALRPCPERGTILLIFSGPVSPAGIPELCDRVRELLEMHDGDLVICDVSALTPSDAVTVDALARVQLTARRLGRQIWLQEACERLRELLSLMGLSDVVPLAPRSHLQPGGQAEEWEPTTGIEEEADPGDPIA